MPFLKHIFNPIISAVIPALSILLEKIYGLNYSKFYVLETIARIPYFSYLAVLHLYQSFGQKPALELLDLHYKETVNEEYHLMIMEELGGGEKWYNKLTARILGFFYYGAVFILYLIAPASGYYLMEMVESFAAKSYTEFLEKKKEMLKQAKASGFAYKYYFSKKGRMTEIKEDKNFVPTLYDVFTSIRNDELVHVSDMQVTANMKSLYSKNRGKEIVEDVLKRGI
jgi:ubiquinol oxidase